MKVGLIPPIPDLKYWGRNDFHLLLTHLLSNPFYADHYRMERERGAYLCLDNSAHEFQEGQDAEKLMLHALMLKAQEVVVPDVLFKAEETVQRCIDTHEVWFEHDYQGMRELNPSLMYVPQAENIEEYAECLNELVRLHLYVARHHHVRKDFVVGVSKDYETWDGGIMQVMKAVISPLRDRMAKQGVNAHVHLLGWGRDLWALGKVAAKYKWIRSTDSAKPFVYARSKIMLDLHKDPPPYPGRPDDYFDKALWGEDRRQIAGHNVAVFRKVAGA